jgi:hypothetical protein
MNEPRHEPPNPLAGLAPPAAPPGLREKVLAAAGMALLEPPLPVDRWSRIWENPAGRLAWAAAVVLLLGGHALVPGTRAARPADLSPAALARSARGAEAEILAIVSLPRIDLDARPLRTDSDPTPRRHVPPPRSAQKETPS